MKPVIAVPENMVKRIRPKDAWTGIIFCLNAKVFLRQHNGITKNRMPKTNWK